MTGMTGMTRGARVEADTSASATTMQLAECGHIVNLTGSPVAQSRFDSLDAVPLGPFL